MQCFDIADRLATQAERPGSPHEQRPLVLRPALSLVPVDPSGSHDYSTRNAGGLASGRLSLRSRGQRGFGAADFFSCIAIQGIDRQFP
jgi:hypothetical protein